MNTIGPLLWKEWREQSWRLAFGAIVLAALAFIGLRARVFADETMVLDVCALGFSLLPVLTSTGQIPADRSEGAMESLLALPVTARNIFLVKTAAGLVLCAGPMAAAAVVSVTVAQGREITTGMMLSIYLRSTLTALSLFIWMQTLTVQLPSEARAAMLAVGIFIIWSMASVGLAVAKVPSYVQILSPFSFVNRLTDIGMEGDAPLLLTIAAQCGIGAVLGYWASTRLAAGAAK